MGFVSIEGEVCRVDYFIFVKVCVCVLYLIFGGRVWWGDGVNWCACERGGWFWVKRAGGGDLPVIKYYIDNFRRANECAFADLRELHSGLSMP